MSKVLVQRTNGKTAHMIGGICATIVATVVAYFIGYMIATSGSFGPENFGVKFRHQVVDKYLMVMLASLASLIAYIVMYKVVGSRSETEYLGLPSDKKDGKKYLFSGWYLAGIISAAVTYLCGWLLTQISFSPNGPAFFSLLMWWVILIQAVLNFAVFFIPAFWPLKRFGS